MRIPITKSDLDDGRLTRTARALQKLWSSELSLMQAQNVLSVLCGYRNLHDLQENVQLKLSPMANTLSRADIAAALKWRLARRYGVSLTDGAALVSKLHLENLTVDTVTLDAALERSQADYRAQGKFLIMDEAWSVSEPHWHPQTPALLDAAVPGYSFAVLPDRRVFRWSLLENLLDHLPTDYLAELQLEPMYAGDRIDTIQAKFFADELLPQACEPLVKAVKTAHILPAGFSIFWLFTKNGECIGRALKNATLGGIVPVIYDIENDDIFKAAGALLCGEKIVPVGESSKGAVAPVFTLKFGFGGYDLQKDIRAALGSRDETSKPTMLDLIQLPGAVQAQGDGGSLHWDGPTFIEREQVYLRDQQWMKPIDIPSFVISRDEIPSTVYRSSENGYSDTTAAIPEAADTLYLAADERTKRLFLAAANRLHTDPGAAAVLELLLSIADFALFDAHCDTLIDEDLPSRYEGDSADDPSLIDDRKRALETLQWNGQRIVAAVPELAVFKATSLGLVLLLINGEYPDSRNSGFIDPPDAGDHKKITNLLAGMVLHVVCCMNKVTPPHGVVDFKVLKLVVDRVLSGKTGSNDVPGEFRAMMTYRKLADAQAQFCSRISEWRLNDDLGQRLRAAGRFLSVGEAIPRQKPKGLSELMSLGRKHVTTTVAQQSWPLTE